VNSANQGGPTFLRRRVYPRIFLLHIPACDYLPLFCSSN
jgi:hypothetical protein